MMKTRCICHKPMQSPVPDLIYEDQQTTRIQEISPYLEQPEAYPSTAILHRLTVFLTFACNLACPYCKTIVRSPEVYKTRPEKRLNHNLASFKALLNSLHPMQIRHIHFTGGEALLNPEMPDMIRYAKSQGVAYTSVTSNGALPTQRYTHLVEAGISEIRISLDTDSALLGKDLTQRSGAWQRTLETYRVLAELSQNNPHFFLIINSVVGKQNRKHLPQLLHFVLENGPPDDMKLITEVDLKSHLGDFAGAKDVISQFHELLKPFPKEAFPLLRRKLQTVFSAESIGLETLPVPKDSKDWRCYIPLSERTVDTKYYYPCSVYLREGGAPLGKLTESLEEQSKKTARFVNEGDCLKDSICQAFCLNCTRNYNQQANDFREGNLE